MSTELSNIWHVFQIDESSILELRAIYPNGNARTEIFYARKHQSLLGLQVAFQHSAERHNNRDANCYMVLNPIKPDFMGSSAKDKDIAARTLLLIDIDRVGTKENPASDSELKHAEDLADAVMAYLDEKGWRTPRKVMSGNGYHLYYKLDRLEPDDESRTLIRTLLNLLADRFDNANVQIDRSVFNASRITKVIGTIVRIGDELPDRPYRMARLIQ